MHHPDDAQHRVAHYEGKEKALENLVHRSFYRPDFLMYCIIADIKSIKATDRRLVNCHRRPIR
jgi:hypothetical protein